jgi:hypothetical protein
VSLAEKQAKAIAREERDRLGSRGEFNLSDWRDATKERLRSEGFNDRAFDTFADAVVSKVDEEDAKPRVSRQKALFPDTDCYLRLDGGVRVRAGLAWPDHMRAHFEILKRNEEQVRAARLAEEERYQRIAPYHRPGMALKDAIEAYQQDHGEEEAA